MSEVYVKKMLPLQLLDFPGKKFEFKIDYALRNRREGIFGGWLRGEMVVVGVDATLAARVEDSRYVSNVRTLAIES